MDSTAVRIDKWLWAARFYKTRSLAQGAVELGRIRIDGARLKPARLVKLGEELEIQLGEERLNVLVRGISDVRGPAPVARTLYEETAESRARRDRRMEVRRFGAEPAAALKGRPTKRDRRQLRQVATDET